MARLPQLDALIAKLDPDQRHVVEWSARRDRHLRVLASAGSGKTTTMTASIARQIADGEVEPSRAAVTTFSNKAAAELQERIRLVLDATSFRALRIGTFHSLALKALRVGGGFAYGNLTHGWTMQTCLDADGRTRNPGIPTGAILWRCATEWGEMPGTGAKSLKCAEGAGDNGAAAYMRWVEILRGKGIEGPDEIEETADLGVLPEFAEAWQLVLDAKRALDCWDFGDALAAWQRGMAEGRLRDSADVVIVDEAQDNNRVQLNIAKLLAGFVSKNESRGKIVLTGDLRQTLYRFRGAYPELLERAAEELGAETREIRTNYRSGQAIVQLANAIADDRPWNVGTPSKAHRGEQGAIEVVTSPDVCTTVAERIRDDLRAGVSAGDITILCRTNAALGLFQAALTEAQVPCAIVGGKSIFDHREVETVLCYCVLSQRDAWNSLEKVLNYPKRYLGRAFWDAMQKQKALGTPMLVAIDRAAVGLPPAVRRNAVDLKQTIMDLRKTDWREVPDQIVKLVTPPPDKLRKLRLDDAPDEDRPALYRAAARIAGRFEDAVKLVEFAGRCTANAASVNEGDNVPGGRVTLSTVHRFKGREAPQVYVHVGKDLFPHKRVTTDTLEDEIRLFYVATTRPKDRLIYAFDTKVDPWESAGGFLQEYLPRMTQDACDAYGLVNPIDHQLLIEAKKARSAKKKAAKEAS
jgi:DNA helicase-2/ATP-dependent DNA helicase PcrA